MSVSTLKKNKGQTNWKKLFRDYEDEPSIIIDKVPDGSKIVVVSDQQVPFEDKRLLRTIFDDFVPEYTKGAKESHLFINGDGGDNYSLSRFLQRPDTNFTFDDEVNILKGYLGSWGSRFTHRHFGMGNHEVRYAKYIAENAPKVAGVVPRYHELLTLDKLGYDWVPYKRYYNIMGFIIAHGSRTIDNDAKAMLQAYHKSGTSGHTNRPKSWTYANAAGDDPITWYTTGMTCDPSIGNVIDDFKDAVGWQQGFLCGEIRGGSIYVENVRVHHGRFLAGGEIYDIS
jgi:hypothetical protein